MSVYSTSKERLSSEEVNGEYRTIFKALKIQAEIVILYEIQELQESVPRLDLLHSSSGLIEWELFPFDF